MGLHFMSCNVCDGVFVYLALLPQTDSISGHGKDIHTQRVMAADFFIPSLFVWPTNCDISS